MSSWRPLLDRCLDELLRAEGRGEEKDKLCPGCNDPNATPTIRCKDCYGGQIFCIKCTLHDHQSAPFHRVEVRTSFVVYIPLES